MSAFTRIASFDDDIDFRRVWRVGISISLVLVVICTASLIWRGLNLGIDFKGGTSWDVPSKELSADDARSAIGSAGDGAKVQAIGRGESRIVRVQTDAADPEEQSRVNAALAKAAGVEETDITVSTVGPSWGSQVSAKAQRALVYFFILIALYITIRLEWKMAVAALASVVHDLILSVGFYALLRIEVTPATVIAFLTILGYSLYDTVVVFDRVKENAAVHARTGKLTYTSIMSLSLNQVLMRSINTTVSSLLPVLSMLVIGAWVLGAVALQEFAVALAVGLLSGAASSIIVAAPVVTWLKEREPRFREIKARLAQRGAPVPAVAMAGGPALGDGAEPSAPAAVEGAAPPPLSGRPIPPRPRKKGKKR